MSAQPEVAKTIWTDADFDAMDWHDNAVHAIALEPGPSDPGRLLLDPLTERARGRLLDGDDDFALGVPFAQVAQRLRYLAERIAAVDDRRDLPGLAQLDERSEVLDA